MEKYKQDILNYSDDVNDWDSSPFKSLRMLHHMTNIYKKQHQLDFEESVLPGYYDLKRVEDAKGMEEHIAKNFQVSGCSFD